MPDVRWPMSVDNAARAGPGAIRVQISSCVAVPLATMTGKRPPWSGVPIGAESQPPPPKSRPPAGTAAAVKLGPLPPECSPPKKRGCSSRGHG
eukprot:14463324-Alexandrium_andersonii.AAC.1